MSLSFSNPIDAPKSPHEAPVVISSPISQKHKRTSELLWKYSLSKVVVNHFLKIIEFSDRSSLITDLLKLKKQ
jgi:hypothetical protein